MLIENPKPLEQITSRIHTWQEVLSQFFQECEEYANFYRLVEGSKTTPNSFTKTRIGETTRATEALTTSIYRMMTSNEPPYEAVSLNGMQTSEQLAATMILLRWQDYQIKYKRRLLRSIRSGVLFGTTIVETPWATEFKNGRLLWESLNYVPRSLLQCAFEPNVFAIEESPWFAFLDYFHEDQLLDFAQYDPKNWDPIQIQKAIEASKDKNQISSRLEERRRRAGYRDLPMYEVCTYYGRLRDLPRTDQRLWKIKVINQSVPVYAGPNPSPTGRIPVKVARYVDFELEPLGYGVGRLGRLAQRVLDDNRNQYMDIARMGLMNMWIKDRLAGVKNSELKIKPLGIIEADSIDGLKPYVPDLNLVTMGLKMEEVYRAEHQGNTGATPNLQAQVTDASATESSIAQNEAIRRVSVIAEDMADSLIRDFQMEKHEYNKDWLQSDLMLAVSGMPKPLPVNRRTIARDVELFVRITTDKDFRPKRTEHLMQVFQTLSSVRSIPNINVDILPVLKELVRALDVNPGEVVKSAPVPNAVLALQMAMKNAQGAAQELGPEAAARLDEGGAPGMSVADTPVGGVALTP